MSQNNEDKNCTSEALNCEPAKSWKFLTCVISTAVIGLILLAISFWLSYCLLRKTYRKKKDSSLLKVTYNNEHEQITTSSTTAMVDNDLYDVGIPSPTSLEISRTNMYNNIPAPQENEYQDINPYEAIR
ncbi:hypothetical protein CHUAL_004965 [Chamberlinius hualienensis]